MTPRWAVTALALFSLKPDLMAKTKDLSTLEFLITNPLDPDLYFNAMELICNEGYPVQQHTVTSDDGYIINVHRIPNGVRRMQRSSPTRRGYTRFHHHVHPDYYDCVNGSAWEKPTGSPVLLQHGLIAASDSWVLQGAGYDLAYLLADAGYDVWMSDTRGNYYSRKHAYRSTKSKEYWDFSFHEVGYYDIPAVIDYILAVTNRRQLHYIGHSMGTVVLFVMGATRPEYMAKLRLATLLAPVANVSSTLTEPPRGVIAHFTERALYELDKRQLYEFAPRVNWFPLVINRFCSKRSPFQDICYDIGLSIDGHAYYNVIRKTFARMVSHFLSGASIKTFLHFFQLLEAKRFQYYDYGEEENFRRYHQVVPPEYDVSRVTCPVALFYSDTDLFEDAEQVEQTATLLPNVIFMKRLTNFLHTDFIIARNAREKVYYDVIDLVNTY